MNAEPFPHVVIDNFLPDEILEQIVEEFPGPEENAWTLWGPGDIKHTRNRNIEKLGTSNEEAFGPLTRHFMAQLNSYTFVQFIQELTKSKYIIVVIRQSKVEENQKMPPRRRGQARRGNRRRREHISGIQARVAR